MRRIDFTQTGPTCGFYAMEYAAAMVNGRKASKENVKKALCLARDKGLTKVGEIFDLDTFSTIFDKAYKNEGLIAIIRTIGTEAQLKKTMDSGSVVFPVNGRKGVPHYFTLCGFVGNKIETINPCESFTHLYRPDVLFKRNKDIEDHFSWTMRYYNKSKFALLKKSLRYWLHDKEIYAILRGMEDVHHPIYDRELDKARICGNGEVITPVDMAGRYLLIKKIK